MAKRRRRRSKAKLFGFPLSKKGAQWVFIIGILVVIGASIQLLWLVYSFATVGTAMAAWGVMTWYVGSYMTYMIPWIVIIITMITLGFYMVVVGKKGR